MIHYIGNFVDPESTELYSYNVPGMKKMEYVIAKLRQTGESITVLSLCRGRKRGFHAAKYQEIDNGSLHLQYRASCVGNKMSSMFDLLLYKFQLYYYVLTKVKPEDTVVIYHSVRSTHTLAKIKKIRNANWILEVEEIYGYGAAYDNPHVGSEIADIKTFEKFIFVNNVLPKMLDVSKNYTVCYGAYLPLTIPKHSNDGIIRVVYAGTIENSKVGAYTAVNAARYLPANYEMHIAGFGNEESINKLKSMIEANNAEYDCKIKYHGKLEGKDLDDLLFSCDIGLSTYVIRLPFSNCVFPSKLTTYVCHGLKVVIGRSENFEKAEIANGWTYYEENTGAAIAEGIIRAAASETVDCSELIRRLDSQFATWLKKNI